MWNYINSRRLSIVSTERRGAIDVSEYEVSESTAQMMQYFIECISANMKLHGILLLNASITCVSEMFLDGAKKT